VSEIRRAVVKSYNAATHKADVQIAGSLAVWLDDVRVATNIPPADVVSGRQCSVLFLDPSNQDEAVIIAIQGAAPSVGEILVATATVSLTLTTTAQSITGDGDSSKVRILLPTPGDWLIEATCDFHITTAAANLSSIGELFVNDSGAAEAGAVIKEMEALDRATVAQRWKVTTTAADTPVELKARKDGGAGVGIATMAHTRLTATGVKRSTGGGGVTDHGALTGLSDDDHTGYALLAGRAGGQTLQGGAASGEVLTLASTAHATKGYIRALDNLVIKDTLAMLQNAVVNMRKSGDAVGWVGIICDLGGLQSFPTTGQMTGISGKLSSSNVDAVNSAQLFGLDFQAHVGRTTGPPTITNLIGCQAKFSAAASGATITDGAAFKAGRATSLFSAFTRAMGVWIPDVSKAIDTTVYGIRIDDQTLGVNRYLAWFGGANPNLRVDAGVPPDAALTTEGDTNIFAAIMENGAVSVRQLRWRQQSSLGATDKVAIWQ